METPDYMPREGVNGFSLKQEPIALVDSALQVYARAGNFPNSRSLHEAAMEYRRELIRIVTEHREANAEEDAVVIQLRARCDGILRKILVGTFFLCVVLIFSGWLWQTIHR